MINKLNYKWIPIGGNMEQQQPVIISNANIKRLS